MAESPHPIPDAQLAAHVRHLQDRLQAAGMSVALDPSAPVLEQLAQLETALFEALAHSRRDEARQRDRQALLQTFITQMPFAVAMLDCDMRYLAASRRWLTDYRLGDREIIGESHYAIFPEISEAWKAVHRRCLSGASEHSDGEAFPRADGTVDWVRWEITPWHQDDGSIGGIVIFSEDITARHQAEDALHDSESKYRLLFQNMTEGFALYELLYDDAGHPADWRVLEVNDAYARHTGVAREMIEGRRIGELFPQAIPRYLPIFARVVEKQTGASFETLAQAVQRYQHVNTFPAGSHRFASIIEDITDRKRAEEALQHKEAELSEAQRLAHIGSWYWDKVTDVTTGSDELLRLYGFDPATQNMPSFAEQRGSCYPVEDWERINAAVLYALETGIGYELDVRVHRGGSLIWVTTRGEVARDAQGQSVGLRGTVQDITDRKRAEEALRESEARYRGLVEQAMDGIFLADAQGRYIDVNTAGAQMLGYTPEEICRMSVTDVILPVDVPRMPTQMADLAGGAIMRNEWQFRRKDGTSFTGEVVGRQLPDGRLLGILRDITDRKRAEDALRESEERYRELVQNANSVIIRWRADGTITFFNEYAQVFFGYTEAEVLGQSVGILVPAQESTGADLSGLVRDITAHPERYVNNVNENVRRDGSRVWMAWTNKPIFDAAGQMVEILAVGSDITDLHEAQERERRYLYTLAHNLRAPATVIQGNMELLLETLHAGGQPVPEALAHGMQRGLHRMNDMIEDFFLVTCLQEGTVTLRLAPTALAPVVDTLLRQHAAVLDAGRIDLDLPPDLPPVCADPDYLQTILLNLLDNAEKFSAADSPIRVSARRAGDTVAITVSDRGIGMAAKDLPHVFDRFYRVGAIRKAEGTGLGLYIVKRLVDAHGGELSVESTPGVGTTVTVTLPVAL